MTLVWNFRKLGGCETSSLFVSRPEIVNELLQKLQTDVKRGRSTEGENMENDVEKIVLWKSGE